MKTSHANILVLTLVVTGCAAAPEGVLFAGDGGTAVANAVCLVNNGGCDPHAVCTGDANGAPLCACNVSIGFEGDGFTCADQLGALNGLRWELPCDQDLTPTGVCTIANVPVVVSTVLGGDPAHRYNVSLRFRGVVELRDYTGGTNDGAFWQIGGDTPTSANNRNIYKLEISTPEQIYYINRGANLSSNMGISLGDHPIDYIKTVTANGGATFTLTADPVDPFEGDNHPGIEGAGTPSVIPGIPPAPLPFLGQFVQMDVVR